MEAAITDMGRQILELRAQVAALKAEAKLDSDTMTAVSNKLIQATDMWIAARAEAKRSAELAAMALEQLAWFRRESSLAHHILAGVRGYRYGSRTKEELIELLHTEMTDTFLQFREPTIAPWLASDIVIQALGEARARLHFEES